MRHQKMQPTFILLIMAVSLIGNLSCGLRQNPDDNGGSVKKPKQICGSKPCKQNESSTTPTTNAPRASTTKAPPAPLPAPTTKAPPAPLPAPTTKAPPAPPPAPTTKAPPAPPPAPTTSPPTPPPSPASQANEQKKVGRVVGLLFLGIAGVLQVGVFSFLVFKRWQIPRIQDETGVRLVS